MPISNQRIFNSPITVAFDMNCDIILAMSNENTDFARAIAVRNLDEQQRAQRRFAEITGDQYQPMNPLIREAILLSSTRINELLLTQPTALPGDVQSLIAAVFDNLGDDVFDQMIRDTQQDGKEPLQLTGSHLRSMSKSTAEAAVSSLVPVSMIDGGFRKTLSQIDSARKIGAERGTKPETIFANDNLYAEMIRRTQTPSQFAEIGIRAANHLTPERMTQMIMDMVPAFAETFNAIEGGPAVDQEDVQDIRREMSESNEFQELIRTFTVAYIAAIKILTGEEIVRFWGQDGLDSLPKTVRADILGASTIL